MDDNSATYSDAIERKISAKTGTSYKSEWVQCAQTNTTYLDCPIAANVEKESMNVVIQNPSSLETKFVKLAVPNGNYDVFVFDEKFKPVASSVVCHQDLDAEKKPVTSCFQHVELPKAIGIKDFALLKLKYNKKADNTIKSTDLKNGDAIGTDDIKLVYKGAVPRNSEIYFEQYKKGTKKNEIFKFSLNWWPSSIGYYDWSNGQNSGDYIFRPVADQYTPNVYSEYKNGKKNGDLSMTFYFEKLNNFT